MDNAAAEKPFEPQMRGWLVQLFEAYAAHMGRTMLTISVRICGGAADFYEALKDGEPTFSAYTFDRSIAGFSDNWPDDLAWPEGVPRFGRDKVRVKKRTPKLVS